MSTSENSIQFKLNGEEVVVKDVQATTTLLQWLRGTGRTGSKCGCDEGDCGACTVALLERDAHGRATYRAINSCIALLPMFAGREVVTVEGLAQQRAAGGSSQRMSLETHATLHPVQAAMVENYGSQCGYCTPGFVMSLFEGYYRADCRTPAAINDQLCGNLCRCTGYRAIRDAARGGARPTCPRDGAALTPRTIGGGSFGLGYARRREWLICPTCRRSVLFDRRRGTRN